jgi:selenocysteine-specific elongation factor
MWVLGTAGHVDHGKSALVRALTGTDPDRLPEERRRGMTIDLGFARLELPDGTALGVVDVPGHEKFVRTMIAGAGGIDLVLFVVAADDGWMPQSQEHLDILRLLDVRFGVVAITKCDLVDDDWVELVEQDVRQHLDDSFLRGAHIVRTAMSDNRGVEEVRATVASLVRDLEKRRDVGKPRLPVDRVFTMPGQGTVVTGTMADGVFETGGRVLVYPNSVEARIRSIQRHDSEVEIALPGSRTALNLSGVSKEQVTRGDVVARPGDGGSWRHLDVSLRSVGDASLVHNRDYELLVGPAVFRARLICLTGDSIEGSDSAPAHLVCERPVCARVGDRIVLRTAADNATVGGGKVLALAEKRTRRREKKRVAFLKSRSDLSSESCVLTEVQSRLWASRDGLLHHSVFSREQVEDAATSLVERGELVEAGAGYADAQRWRKAQSDLLDTLDRTHRNRPDLPGVSAASARAESGLETAVFDALILWLSDEQVLIRDGEYLRRMDFTSRLTEDQKEGAQRVRSRLTDGERGLCSVDALLVREDDRAVLEYLIRSGEAVRISEELVADPRGLEVMKREVRETLSGGPATASVLRERLGLPRRLALPLLEYLDRVRLTVRRGDTRTLVEDET